MGCGPVAMADTPHTPLFDCLPPAEDSTPDRTLEGFLKYVAELGLELYPHQEEAILAVMDDSNVILNTPTGSGKSLVASAVHFKALAMGQRSFYTCPIKALVNDLFSRAETMLPHGERGVEPLAAAVLWYEHQPFRKHIAAMISSPDEARRRGHLIGQVGRLPASCPLEAIPAGVDHDAVEPGVDAVRVAQG